MTAAAFQATYSDLRLVKGRKVVQFVFEVPLEGASQAMDMLGGMPNPASEVWCAIARLNLKEVVPDKSIPPETMPRSRDGLDGLTGGARRPFASLPLPQQAALLCNDPVFRAFLNEEFGYACETAGDAAEAVRERCGVKSRSELQPNTPEGMAFITDREQFQAWKLAAA